VILESFQQQRTAQNGRVQNGESHQNPELLLFSANTQPLQMQDQKSLTSQVVELKLDSPPSTPKIFPVPQTVVEIAKPAPEVFLTGFGTQYPPWLHGPEELEKFIRATYDSGDNAGYEHLSFKGTHS
jgi:hypothetical protein